MDVEIPILKGTLIVSPQSSFSSFSRIPKKKSLQKHCILFRASRHGIERLEILDKEDDKNPKIITLENCVKITQEPPPANQINIVKKSNKTLTLFALNETDLKRWVEALQNVAFKDNSTTLVREEENDLYHSLYSDADGIFLVNLQEADATPKLKYFIEKSLHIVNNKPIPTTFTLQFTATEIQLKYLDVNGAILITQWPYRYIPIFYLENYGLKFESGRACDTGKGEFKFHTTNPKEVFQCMKSKLKSLKKLINGNSISSLNCGEHQLNAALSMAAGSRSPLPPSPNQSYTDNNQSQNSHLLHGFLSSTDSLNNISMSTTTTSSSLPKIKPCKPPRKSIPSPENGKSRSDVPPKPKYQDYEPVSLAQTGTNDHPKPTSIVLKSLPPPPLPTSPIPNYGNLPPKNTNILPIVSDHSAIKSPVHSPVVDQPPRIPPRYESMIQDDRNYERIENITSAWKTLGVSDIKHTENLSTDDDFSDFVWKRSQSQKEFSSTRKIPITVAYHDAEELSMKKKDVEYDTLDHFAPKKRNPASDYRTIVTITSPAFKKQTSQPVSSNDYEIIGDCATITNTNNVNSDIEPMTYRLADDSHMGYGVLRKPGINNNLSPKSPQMLQCDASGIATESSSSVDDLINHRKFNDLNYAIVNKSNQV